MSLNLPEFETIQIATSPPAVTVTLNRPAVRNAMNTQMVSELTEVFTQLRGNRDFRIIVLTGANGIFCAGGDLHEMRDAFNEASFGAHNGGNLDTMLQACNQADQVVIAKVEGVALGGGLGLVCCSDIAISTETAQFGFPEVRLGIAPSFIAPYVIQRTGLSRARELMLTGRRFSGVEAQKYGIIAQAVQPADLDQAVADLIDELKHCSPGGIAATKEILFTVLYKPTQDTTEYRAEKLNELRQSADAQEGMRAFLEKRTPNWVTDDSS